MNTKPFHILYTTDPLCSFCWAIEPQITKLLFHYGSIIDFEYTMGGLLESDGSFESDEVLRKGLASISNRFNMPINTNYQNLSWAKHSLLACKLYLLVKQEDAFLANKLLRKLREAQMLFNLDISDLKDLTNLLEQEHISTHYLDLLDHERTQRLLYQDFGINRVLDADIYPTLTIIYQDGHGKKLSGYQSYFAMVEALQSLSEEKLIEKPLPSLEDYLNVQDLILFEEIQQVYNLKSEEVDAFVKQHRPEFSKVIEISAIKYLKKLPSNEYDTDVGL